MRFRTETGSIYDLDQEKMTWRRLGRSPASGQIRNEHGQLLIWPNIIVGKQAILEDDTIKAGYDRHYVATSRVTEIYTPKAPQEKQKCIWCGGDEQHIVGYCPGAAAGEGQTK